MKIFSPPAPLRAAALILVLSLALTAPGCDDDDGEGQLPGACQRDFTPCSNNAVGAWTLQSMCQMKPPGCSGAVAFAPQQTSGSLTLSEDGSASLGWDLDYRTLGSIPVSCLAEGQTCEDLDGAGCDLSGSACDCNGSSGRGRSASGTWAVEGDSVVITLGTPGDPDADVIEFCVADDGSSANMRRRSDGFQLSWLPQQAGATP